MNGFTIPNLEMGNASNAVLLGNARIGSSLLFTAGKISAGNFNLNLSDAAVTTGMGAGKFIETNGTGQVIKELSANVTSNEIPVGAGNIYRPAFITASGTYSSANGGIKVLAVPDPNRPPSLSDYVAAYWPVTRTGITGTITLGGQYDNADISGTEGNLRGYYYNANDWSSAGQTNDVVTNRISAPITGVAGELSAMSKFNLVKTRALLQGAYPTFGGAGIMNDNLRATPTQIPNAEPHRSAPYTSVGPSTGNFTHVANTINEVASSSVFNDLATNDNIVDWVFLELRNNNASPGNTVLQTRSALIQKDGDIVDVDGISPVTFNNIANGNYTIAVRHRNHLGISTNPIAPNAFSETKSTAAIVDLSVIATNLYGVSGTDYTVSADNKRMLWAGNAKVDGAVKYNFFNNDQNYILATSLSNNTATILNPVYSESDVNLDRSVKYNFFGNDKGFILINVLGNNTATIRTQNLPN